MPFICYVDKEFSGKSSYLIKQANEIIQEYVRECGYKTPAPVFLQGLPLPLVLEK